MAKRLILVVICRLLERELSRCMFSVSVHHLRSNVVKYILCFTCETRDIRKVKPVHIKDAMTPWFDHFIRHFAYILICCLRLFWHYCFAYSIYQNKMTANITCCLCTLLQVAKYHGETVITEKIFSAGFKIVVIFESL